MDAKLQERTFLLLRNKIIYKLNFEVLSKANLKILSHNGSQPEFQVSISCFRYSLVT